MPLLPGFAQNRLVLALNVLHSAAAQPGAAGKTRQLLSAMVGLAVIVALPAFAVYYARRRWRP